MPSVMLEETTSFTLDNFRKLKNVGRDKADFAGRDKLMQPHENAGRDSRPTLQWATHSARITRDCGG